jgi:hypothetical protein
MNNMNNNQIILYQTADGETKLEVKLQDETVWLTQAQMADLFQKDVSTISRHIGNIFSEGELVEETSTLKQANLQKMQIGLDKPTTLYNLDVIISVGYRVSSHRGTQFRMWATKQLREYIVKGFVMDDARLANGGTVTGTSYFDEMLERVRKIRASEKNFYQKVRDIFATSVDYDPKTDYAKQFYASVQNKFHYAVTGSTAAELIAGRVDSAKPHMGLTNFQGTEVTRQEAEVAKNYMLETELRQLYLLTEQFLSHAEFQIERKRPMHMADWQRRLDDFLKLNELEILEGKGGVSHEQMEAQVKRELQRYLRQGKIEVISGK